MEIIAEQTSKKNKLLIVILWALQSIIPNQSFTIMIDNNIEKELNSFTKENLAEALGAINSLIQKCEKSQEKVTHRTSQWTLLENRLKALNIAKSLISKELQNLNNDH